MTTSDLLFSCIHCSVGGMAMTDDEKGAVNDQSLAALYKLSVHHDLAHLVCDALQKNGLLPDSPIGEMFRRQKDLALYRYIQQSAVFDDLCRAFEEAEIVFLPLKGSIVRNYYPEPWMRTSCDLDVLVHEEDLERTISLLSEQLGCIKGPEQNFHDVSIYTPSGVHIELHFHIKEGDFILDTVSSRVWEYTQNVKGKNCWQELTNEFLMFHQLAHMSYHFVKGGCGIKPFVDCWLLSDKLDFDRKRLAELLEAGGIKQFSDRIFALGEKLFSEKHDNISALEQQMLEYVYRGGTYGTKENSIRTQQAQEGGSAKNILRRIWPSYETLVNYHGAPPNRKYLQPIYEARRWWNVILRKEKRENWTWQLKQNLMVSDGARQEMAQLLTHLGLSDKFIHGQ